jgi:hypothetical protein
LSDKYPNNIDAERAVLGSILVNPEAMAVAVSLFPEGYQGVFYDKNLQDVYNSMVSLYMSGLPVDGIPLVSQLDKDGIKGDVASISFISDLMGGEKSGNIEHYISIVRECYERRVAMASSKTAYTGASNMSTPLAETLASASSAIQSIASPSTHSDFVDDEGDPGPIPEDLLHVPGFIEDVMKHTMDSSHYPNHAMAFSGALSLMAMLISRKVTDKGNTRANLYTLGLAPSGSGKNDPRNTNKAIMNRVYLATSDRGAMEAMLNKVGSSEGIEDHLTECPSTLWQCDEMDHLIAALANGGDTNARKIMQTLLQLFSDSSGTYSCRKLARSKDRDDAPRAIESPCLSFFGTGVPQYFYEALSEQMLSNGFFSRMIIIESDSPRVAQEHPTDYNHVSQDIVDAAMYWWSRDSGMYGRGAESDKAPVLMPIKRDPQANVYIRVIRSLYDDEYNKADAEDDALGTSVWARAYQMTMKLAMIYACSESAMNPEISIRGVEWAAKFIDHQCRRMIFKARERSFGSDHEKDLKKLFAILKGSKDFTAKRSAIARKMRYLSSKQLDEVVDSMVESGMVKRDTFRAQMGRPSTILTLIKQED